MWDALYSIDVPSVDLVPFAKVLADLATLVQAPWQ